MKISPHLLSLLIHLLVIYDSVNFIAIKHTMQHGLQLRLHRTEKYDNWSVMNWKGFGRQNSRPNLKYFPNMPGGSEHNHEEPQQKKLSISDDITHQLIIVQSWSMWTVHEPPSSSTYCCSTHITSNCKVTEEQPARDQRLITLTWGLETSIHSRRKCS